jgi:hypothetical protein
MRRSLSPLLILLLASCGGTTTHRTESLLCVLLCVHTVVEHEVKEKGEQPKKPAPPEPQSP